MTYSRAELLGFKEEIDDRLLSLGEDDTLRAQALEEKRQRIIYELDQLYESDPEQFEDDEDLCD